MILVTGANGFIGSAMIWELNGKGIENIVAVDSISLEQRSQPLHKRKFQQFLLKDEIWDFLKSPAGSKLQWIIHMGACSSTTETNWNFLLENNTEYTKRIAQWCHSQGCNLIYASSAATYGDGAFGFDDEINSEKLKPLNLYGESKILVDRWILKQRITPPHWYGLKFFNVFGPNEYLKESMASVAFKAFNQIRATHKLGLFKSYNPNYHDGEQMRDFIYVKDVTNFMWELMQKKPTSGIYNIGSGKARTWLELATSIFRAMNLSTQIDWLEMPENIRNQYQYFTESKMTKWLEAGMGGSRWTLEVAIKDYVQNYLSQPDPWL